MGSPWSCPEEEVQVWCACLEANSEAIERAHRQLSLDEQERASRFRSPALRANFVLSRSVLRTLLAHFCDCLPQDIEFAYGEHGKPFLASPASAIRFNLSHSGNLAAYAFAINDELGVDVEKHRSLADMEQIAHQFFCPAEYAGLLHIPVPERLSAFFDGWVRKEAFIKALGRGLSIPLNSFQVSLRPGQSAALLAVNGDIEDARAWSIFAFAPENGYSGAVALRRQSCTIRIHTIQPAVEILANSI